MSLRIESPRAARNSRGGSPAQHRPLFCVVAGGAGDAAIAAGENPRNICCLSHLQGRAPVPVHHWIELFDPAA